MLQRLQTDPMNISNLTSKNFGNVSRPRNPTIAYLLLRAGFIEKSGTGINRTKDAVKEHGYGKVEFIYDEYYFKVMFTREQETKLRAELEKSGYGAGRVAEESSEEIIKLMQSNPKITASKIAQELKITSRAVEKRIYILKRMGKIERVGLTKGGSWHVI